MTNKDCHDFWVEYMKAVEAGELRSEFAKRMGIPSKTVFKRVHAKQQQGWPIKHLETGSFRGRSSQSEFLSVMSKFGIEKVTSETRVVKAAKVKH